jgi:hypothetical protein
VYWRYNTRGAARTSPTFFAQFLVDNYLSPVRFCPLHRPAMAGNPRLAGDGRMGFAVNISQLALLGTCA